MAITNKLKDSNSKDITLVKVNGKKVPFVVAGGELIHANITAIFEGDKTTSDTIENTSLSAVLLTGSNTSLTSVRVVTCYIYLPNATNYKKTFTLRPSNLAKSGAYDDIKCIAAIEGGYPVFYIEERSTRGLVSEPPNAWGGTVRETGVLVDGTYYTKIQGLYGSSSWVNIEFGIFAASNSKLLWLVGAEAFQGGLNIRLQKGLLFEELVTENYKATKAFVIGCSAESETKVGGIVSANHITYNLPTL